MSIGTVLMNFEFGMLDKLLLASQLVLNSTQISIAAGVSLFIDQVVIE